MNMLIPSSFPETLLHYPDSISLKDSLQSPWMTPATDIDDVDGDHPPQHASDADFELAVAEYGLWLPDQHDLYLSEVLAMDHDELLASAFAEMVPKKGTVPNPVDLTDENPPKSTSNGLGKLLCATGNSESCHHHLSAPRDWKKAGTTRPRVVIRLGSVVIKPTILSSFTRPAGEKAQGIFTRFLKVVKTHQGKAVERHAA
ncbi:hypothetical protein F5883DRAFT_529533 [Diaporthe sp. PMI_573]|nr:hypothetical protein F5883DRAFT_529533 [Diaporthaceae sp. PMI_573]